MGGTGGGARLVVFAGLPGVGKTSLARATATGLDATYLRIDTIETAIQATLTPVRGNPVGYVVAARVAADQLRAGRPVVADAVNGVAEARRLWVDLAAGCAAPVRFVEVVCSDPAEHRRRVEARVPDLPGQSVPTWTDVQDREWQPFTGDRLVVDNTGDPADAVARVLTWLSS
ncbi:AAA family ATPase [Pseudonocardia sp. HH130630-07]|uniref:AAA family ATPase n=1 Tax=Pseudonocardia sp. HH130630-07 TaxID=1690815 RepID=UPI000814C853|nr:ATP-binding protein [Pseudonocardia sp. HH130630-07]ANY05645.1 hypothetical protein AFB00_04265 [Pseudonocardia sp. HH130630-07]